MLPLDGVGALESYSVPLAIIGFWPNIALGFGGMILQFRKSGLRPGTVR